VLESGATGSRPATEHDDITAGDVHSVTESVLWWRSTDPESGPNVGLSVQNSNVIQIALLESGTLTFTSFFHLVFIVIETTMDYQVSSDQDGAMTLSGAGRGA